MTMNEVTRQKKNVICIADQKYTAIREKIHYTDGIIAVRKRGENRIFPLQKKCRSSIFPAHDVRLDIILFEPFFGRSAAACGKKSAYRLSAMMRV